jgi:hypothetical protein
MLRLALKISRSERKFIRKQFASKPKPNSIEFDTSYKDSISPGFKLVHKNTANRRYKLVGFLTLVVLMSPFVYALFRKIYDSLDPAESKYTDVEPLFTYIPSSLEDISLVSKKVEHFLAAPEEGMVLSSVELNVLLDIIPSLSNLKGLIYFDLPDNENQIRFYTSIPIPIKTTKSKNGFAEADEKIIEYINSRMTIIPKKNSNAQWEGYISAIEVLPVHKFCYSLERKFKDIDFFNEAEQDAKQILDKIDTWYVDRGEVHINSKPVDENAD